MQRFRNAATFQILQFVAEVIKTHLENERKENERDTWMWLSLVRFLIGIQTKESEKQMIEKNLVSEKNEIDC